LAIVPADGPDNLQAPIGTGLRVAPPPAALNPSVPANALGTPQLNVRFYQLGTKGSGNFQNTAGNPGANGNTGGIPRKADYDTAFKAADREIDLYNLMVLPKDVDHTEADTMKLWGPASVACQQRRAFLIIDPPEKSWQSAADAVDLSKGVNKLRV